MKLLSEKGLGLNKKRYSSFRRKGKNYLFVIAIDDYEFCPKLSNCVKDATSFIELLISKYQFEEKYLTFIKNKEASRDNIFNAFISFRKKIKPKDNLVIVYTGHGERDLEAGENEEEVDAGFWIPVDAEPLNKAQFLGTDEIKGFLNKINSHHTFLIVDACFGGAIFTSAIHRSVNGSELRPSRWGISASHSRELVSDGNPGTNSPFATALLEILQDCKEKIGGQELGIKLQKRVAKLTKQQQSVVSEPLNVKGHDSGQFFFHLKQEYFPNIHSIRPVKTENLVPLNSIRKYLFDFFGFIILLVSLFWMLNYYNKWEKHSPNLHNALAISDSSKNESSQPKTSDAILTGKRDSSTSKKQVVNKRHLQPTFDEKSHSSPRPPHHIDSFNLTVYTSPMTTIMIDSLIKNNQKLEIKLPKGRHQIIVFKDTLKYIEEVYLTKDVIKVIPSNRLK